MSKTVQSSVCLLHIIIINSSLYNICNILRNIIYLNHWPFRRRKSPINTNYMFKHSTATNEAITMYTQMTGERKSKPQTTLTISNEWICENERKKSLYEDSIAQREGYQQWTHIRLCICVGLVRVIVHISVCLDHVLLKHKNEIHIIPYICTSMEYGILL